MIIDIILERQEHDGMFVPTPDKKGMVLEDYTPKLFYDRVMEYYNIFPEVVEPIADALDGGTNYDVKKALSIYIIENDHPAHIVQYIQGAEWMDDALE